MAGRICVVSRSMSRPLANDSARHWCWCGGRRTVFRSVTTLRTRCGQSAWPVRGHRCHPGSSRSGWPCGRSWSTLFESFPGAAQDAGARSEVETLVPARGRIPGAAELRSGDCRRVAGRQAGKYDDRMPSPLARVAARTMPERPRRTPRARAFPSPSARHGGGGRRVQGGCCRGRGCGPRPAAVGPDACGDRDLDLHGRSRACVRPAFRQCSGTAGAVAGRHGRRQSQRDADGRPSSDTLASTNLIPRRQHHDDSNSAAFRPATITTRSSCNCWKSRCVRGGNGRKPAAPTRRCWSAPRWARCRSSRPASAHLRVDGLRGVPRGDLFADSSLPRPVRAAKVRELSSTSSCTWSWWASELYPEAYFGGKVSDGTKERGAKPLVARRRGFARIAMFKPFVAGDEFTLADRAVIVYLPVVAARPRRSRRGPVGSSAGEGLRQGRCAPMTLM